MTDFDPRDKSRKIYGVEITALELELMTPVITRCHEKISAKILNSPNAEGERGIGDLGSLLITAARQDLDSLVLQVVQHTYSVDEPGRWDKEQRYWLDNLESRYKDIIFYCAVIDPDFLARLESQIDDFSITTVIPADHDLRQDVLPSIRNLDILENAFSQYSHFIQVASVLTPEYGRVTIVRYNLERQSECTAYSMGFNIENREGPSMGFALDALGFPENLSLVSADGSVARLISLPAPTSMDVYDAVFGVLYANGGNVDYGYPDSPNISLFK